MMYFSEAMRVLLANPVRTFLTVIGLIIGVTAVVAIQTLGHSMAGAISETLDVMADNSFMVFLGGVQPDYTKSAIHLTDLTDIQATVPNVASATPMGGTNDLARHGHNVGRFSLTSDTNPPFNNAPLAFGRRINDDDVSNGTDVMVISWQAYKRLFPKGGDPTGQSIYFGSHRYVLIGVLEKPRQGLLNSQFGGDLTIPYTTFLREYNRDGRFGMARFIVTDPSTMKATEAAVIRRIHELRHVGSNVQYQTFDKATLTNGINGIFTGVTLVVGLIGAVSLLVAGIGVMNIMLVSINERTREIGTRKAIGARRGQILLQFFIESAVLSSIGCYIGMGIGLLIGGFVNTFFIVKLTGYTATLPYMQAFVTTTIFAAIVTLAFGTYPAFRAAGLNPIEALRYE